jgi:hypothetical protein
MSSDEKTTEDQGQRVITGGPFFVCETPFFYYRQKLIQARVLDKLRILVCMYDARSDCLLICSRSVEALAASALCLCKWLSFLACSLSACLPNHAVMTTDWFPDLDTRIYPHPPPHTCTHTHAHTHVHTMAPSQHHYRHSEVVQCQKWLWIHY